MHLQPFVTHLNLKDSFKAILGRVLLLTKTFLFLQFVLLQVSTFSAVHSSNLHSVGEEDMELIHRSGFLLLSPASTDLISTSRIEKQIK